MVVNELLFVMGGRDSAGRHTRAHAEGWSPLYVRRGRTDDCYLSRPRHLRRAISDQCLLFL